MSFFRENILFKGFSFCVHMTSVKVRMSFQLVGSAFISQLSGGRLNFTAEVRDHPLSGGRHCCSGGRWPLGLRGGRSLEFPSPSRGNTRNYLEISPDWWGVMMGMLSILITVLGMSGINVPGMCDCPVSASHT